MFRRFEKGGSNFFRLKNLKWEIITLVPCHCIEPHVNRYHCGAHDAVNQNPHNSRHDDPVTRLADHFCVSCSLGHCLIAKEKKI